MQNFHLYRYQQITLLITLSLLLVGCSSTVQPTQPESPLYAEGREVHASALYVTVTFSQISDNAVSVFVGKVISISPSQWNQDSGKYWCEDDDASEMGCFVVHYVEIEVLQPLVDTIKLERQVRLPVISQSYVVDDKGNVLNEREHPHDFAVGDEAIFFIKQTDLAWRGGLHRVLYLMGNPGDSYFKLGTDGLYHGGLLKEQGGLTIEQLNARIQEERATPCDVNMDYLCRRSVGD